MSVAVFPPLVTPAVLLTDVPTEPIYRLSVAQYHQMIAAGILTEDTPVELLEGWLVTKMTKNPPHTLSTQLLRDALPRLLPAGWFVNDQEPVTTDSSEPEADAAVIRGNRRDYVGRRPHPEDVALVAEVADTTLHQDRTTKKRIYARAGFALYWIINLVDRQIEVYTQPTGPAQQPDYGQRQDYGAADAVPVVIGGQEIGRLAVSEVLP